MEQLAAVRAALSSELGLAEAAAQLRQWIDEDCEITPLEALQGLICQAGYWNGDSTGHVYVRRAVPARLA